MLPERVWLLRHAQSAVPTVFHGAESDIELSELGRKQAEVGADWFRRLSPTVVISSAMIRARHTAAPIAAACGVEHLIEPDLHERIVGILGGTPFSLVEGKWVDTVNQWTAGNTSFTTEGAESFDALCARALPAWERVVRANPGGRVVIVSHGVTCKALLLNLLHGWNPTGWVKLGRVENFSVSELVPDGDKWNAAQLLSVPEPIAALASGEPTGVGKMVKTSEA